MRTEFGAYLHKRLIQKKYFLYLSLIMKRLLFDFLIIDDLVATGGTLANAISLVKLLGGVVVECACVVELKMFINPSEESGLPSRTKLFDQHGHTDVPIWGLISEDVLTNEATLPPNYQDDGEEH